MGGLVMHCMKGRLSWRVDGWMGGWMDWRSGARAVGWVGGSVGGRAGGWEMNACGRVDCRSCRWVLERVGERDGMDGQMDCGRVDWRTGQGRAGVSVICWARGVSTRVGGQAIVWVGCGYFGGGLRAGRMSVRTGGRLIGEQACGRTVA